MPYGDVRTISLEDAKEQLNKLMAESIKEHMLSDVPLGVWLSGGIDSTSILHYASQTSSKPLKTFSISFSGRSFDESSYIKTAVERYGTDHEEMDLNPGVDLEGAIREFSYYSDEPTADAGALPVWFLSRLCKRKTTVALSGEGADELFGGYLTYRANRIARHIRRIPRAATSLGLSLMKRWPVSDEKIGFDYKVKRLLEGSLMPPERGHAYWNGTFGSEEMKSILNRKLPGSLGKILSQVADLPKGDNELAASLWLDQKYYLADDILTKSDRMSMAHSVEVRPPFLDHRIVEFAASLPSKLKIRGSHQKVVLRELMKDKLPATVVKRKKIGFDIPAHEWLRGPLHGMLEDSLEFGSREYGELFRREGIEHLKECHLKRSINVGYHLWGLLILFQWMKRWQVRI